MVNMDALANFVETLDSNPDYEDDCFSFDFQDYRVWCERKRHHFHLEIGHEVYELPRF